MLSSIVACLGRIEMMKNIAVAELMTSLSTSPFRVDASASASASARSGTVHTLSTHACNIIT